MSRRPITTMKLWSNISISQSEVLTSPPIDLREISQNNKFSIEYLFGNGAGLVGISYSQAPTKNGTFVAGDSEIIEYSSDPGMYAVGTVSRAVASNVATVEVDEELILTAVGEYIKIDGMLDSSYNGIHLVTAMPDGFHVSFNLVHADEAETADASGALLQEVQPYAIEVSPIAGLPWLKIIVTEKGTGDVDLIDFWLNIQ